MDGVLVYSLRLSIFFESYRATTETLRKEMPTKLKSFDRKITRLFLSSFSHLNYDFHLSFEVR